MFSQGIQSHAFSSYFMFSQDQGQGSGSPGGTTPSILVPTDTTLFTLT